MQNLPRLLFTALLITTCAAPAADWPRFRGPDQSGLVTGTGLNPQALEGGAKILWRANVGTGFSSIVVAGGRTYTMGNRKDDGKETDYVWCLDANTGNEIWKHSYPEELKPNLYEGGPNATPTVEGGRVFTLSKTGRAFCLDAAKGAVIWEVDLAREVGAKKPEWGFSGSVLIEGDLAIYNVGDAGTALNKETGKVVWKSGPGVAGYSQPVAARLDGKRVAVLMAASEALALNPQTGAVLWRHPWKTSYDVNAADPIVRGNRVFVSSGYNHGAAVLEVKGGQVTELWKSRVLRNQFSSSVLLGDHVYGVDENQLRCVEFATGNVTWTDRVTGKGTLLIADGHILALSEKGELLIAPATPEEFKPVSRAQILGGKCWTMPALAHGKLYARNAKGDLVCVDLAAK